MTPADRTRAIGLAAIITSEPDLEPVPPDTPVRHRAKISLLAEVVLDLASERALLLPVVLAADAWSVDPTPERTDALQRALRAWRAVPR